VGSPIPSRDDFTHPDEVIFEVANNAQPDNLNRIRFHAFWLTDQPWVPNGVRGQVFHADLGRYLAQEHALGHPVRVINAVGSQQGPVL
jgi:hypothetical protein